MPSSPPLPKAAPLFSVALGVSFDLVHTSLIYLCVFSRYSTRLVINISCIKLFIHGRSRSTGCKITGEGVVGAIQFQFGADLPAPGSQSI